MVEVDHVYVPADMPYAAREAYNSKSMVKGK
jgi:hypothetical protein